MSKKHFYRWEVVFLPVLVFFVQTSARAQPAIAYEPLISSGLSSPVEIASAPGDATGRLFIVEKGGTNYALRSQKFGEVWSILLV